MESKATGWLSEPLHRSMSCNGSLLRFYRGELGWSQEELAAKTGFSDRLIRKAESGQPIRADTIEILALTLSTKSRIVTPEELVSDPLKTAKEFCHILSCHEIHAADHARHLLTPDVMLSVAGDPNVLSFAGNFKGVAGYDDFCRRFFSILQCPNKNYWQPRFMGHGNHAISWGFQKLQLAGAPRWITTARLFQFEFRRGKICRIEDEFNVEALHTYIKKNSPTI